MNNKIRKVRIPVEIEQIQKTEKEHGISITTSDGDNQQLLAIIPGPIGSPYEDGKFNVQINISDQYPFRPPIFKLTTPIYHPNIDQSGNICLDLLKMPPTGSYNPAITLESILISIQLLLSSPNPDDPLNGDAADLYKMNQSKFIQRAREYVQKYCTDAGAVENSKTSSKNTTDNVEKRHNTEKATLNKLKLHNKIQ